MESIKDKEILLVGAGPMAISHAQLLQGMNLHFTVVGRGEESAKKFGSQCILVAIDAKRNKNNSWTVYLHGGRTPTEHDAVEWAKKAEDLGAGEILLTSMDRDGTKIGYDLKLTRTISDAVKIPVIASGGVGTIDHMYDGLTEGNADAVLAASIFHFREISIKEVKENLASRGLPIRPVV